MIILLAVLALVVVQALAHSPWGMFTIVMTIPIAIFMGIYMRYLRPGRVLEASIIGFALLLLSIYGGQYVSAHPALSSHFTFEGTTIAWMMIIYGFVASVFRVAFARSTRLFKHLFESGGHFRTGCRHSHCLAGSSNAGLNPIY